jgi:hypothetical protein
MTGPLLAEAVGSRWPAGSHDETQGRTVEAGEVGPLGADAAPDQQGAAGDDRRVGQFRQVRVGELWSPAGTRQRGSSSLRRELGGERAGQERRRSVLAVERRQDGGEHRPGSPAGIWTRRPPPNRPTAAMRPPKVACRPSCRHSDNCRSKDGSRGGSREVGSSPVPDDHGSCVSDRLNATWQSGPGKNND